jgi:pSer/pThr/pTyr-binding forkhead associated (FHA) protein
MTGNQGQGGPPPLTSSPPLIKVSAEIDPGLRREFGFRQAFRIGRLEDCDVCIKNDYVSRAHVEISFENGQWWLRDLRSSNGVFMDGQRVGRIPIGPDTVVRLGIKGPEVSFRTEKTTPPRPVAENKAPAGSRTIVAQYVNHYFGKLGSGESVGQHTMYLRQAFQQVQAKQKRRYGWIIAALALCAIGAAGYAYYEHRQVERQKAMAEQLFYEMKSLDVDIGNLERLVMDSHNPAGQEEIKKYRARRQEMEKNYDQFLATLHVYNPKMTEQERLVLRVARIFGECELNMPRGFAVEVDRYIKKWQSSDRFPKVIQIAKQNGYAPKTTKEMLDQGLPPQFFYLAMQESNFDPYAIGPKTRKGYAKGIWQFVPETAVHYGLHLGPLVDLRRADPADERNHFDKATRAAATYLKDLYTTDAQASGLLVMACYNWGETQVLPLVRSMPQNPRERNFWRLLTNHREQIPQETYDYVFYIASAAVIGENPRLFGFDMDNPLGE